MFFNIIVRSVSVDTHRNNLKHSELVRMLGISWAYRTSKQDVLQRLGKRNEVIRTVKTRKVSYFEHILRNVKDRILQSVT